MKKHVLFSVGMLAFALLSANATNTILYSTDDDWTSWDGTQGLTFQDTTAFDYDGVTVNGIGNSSNAGGAGTGGSLQVSPIVPCNWGQTGPAFGFGGPTTAVLVAMDGPGADYGQPLVAQTGTLLVDYTMPDDTGSGTYFSMGIFFQDNAQWGGWSASQNIDLGPVTTPYGTEEMYEAVIPYSLSPTPSLSYAQIGFWIFTDYTGVKPWYVDNISVVPLPVSVIPAPVTNLFSTLDDFTPWTAAGGDLVSPDSAFSTDGVTINGLGNTTAAGATGTAGSLLVDWSSLETGYGTIASAPDQGGNAAFLQAIDPGCDPGSSTSVAAYGNIYVEYSVPDNTDGGNYFQLGVFLGYNADGYYGNYLWNADQDLGFTDDNGLEVHKATIPYTINAGNFYGFGFGISVNSNYQPVNGFHIGEISVSAAQAPLITGISLNGTSLTINGTNGLTGFHYTLRSSTDISLPQSAWTVVSTGNAFNGPTYSITTTVNPASPPTFYSISVP
jgi:hypothetical protein